MRTGTHDSTEPSDGKPARDPATQGNGSLNLGYTTITSYRIEWKIWKAAVPGCSTDRLDLVRGFPLARFIATVPGRDSIEPGGSLP